MKTRVVLIAVSLAAMNALAYAQTQQEHESHHPNSAAESKSTPALQPPSQPQNGVAGQGGKMDSKSPNMGMMGDRMPMMSMMQMMMGRGGGMDGMAAIDRVEGRIAFLKTELKITDAQSALWNAFADALRSNARKLGEVRSTMNPQDSLVDRLGWQEKWLLARVEGTRAVRTAFVDLAAKLDDEQKTNAEQLLAPHMGLMAMTSGMESAPMMSGSGMGMGASGGMGPGRMPTTPGSPMQKGPPKQ